MLIVNQLSGFGNFRPAKPAATITWRGDYSNTTDSNTHISGLITLGAATYSKVVIAAVSCFKAVDPFPTILAVDFIGAFRAYSGLRLVTGNQPPHVSALYAACLPRETSCRVRLTFDVAVQSVAITVWDSENLYTLTPYRAATATFAVP